MFITDHVSPALMTLDHTYLDPGVMVREEMDVSVGVGGLSVYAGGNFLTHSVQFHIKEGASPLTFFYHI